MGGEGQEEEGRQVRIGRVDFASVSQGSCLQMVWLTMANPRTDSLAPSPAPFLLSSASLSWTLSQTTLQIRKDLSPEPPCRVRAARQDTSWNREPWVAWAPS